MKRTLLSIAVTSLFFTYSCKNAQVSQPEIVKNNGVKSTITDEQLMDQVQKDALKYFWDYAEPNSLLGRERYHEDNIYPDNDKHVITTGGSGFGLATLLVGVERGFVSRKEAVKRLTHIMDFLAKADRHKGAWGNGKNSSFWEKR